MGAATASPDGGAVSKAAYGGLAVEAIEDDGSQKGLGIIPTLVETMADANNALPLLQQGQVSMGFTIQAFKLQAPDEMDEVFSLVEAADQRGIQVLPVPVLSADDGYYPNATNVSTFVTTARALVQQWKARGLAPTMLVVDMEPPRELMQALASLDLTKAIPADHIDRARFAAATQTFTQLVDELHGEGWKVGVTTQGELIADYDDKDDDMRQYFSVVLDGPAWDQIDFQLYRTAYASQAPGLDSYFVYSFAQQAVAQFPKSKVGVGVGLTHPGPIYPDTPTYKSPSELQEDVQAALAAGIDRSRITVYNLKGVLYGPPVCDKLLGCQPTDYHYAANDPASWFVQVASPTPPAHSASTTALKMQFDLMDKLLDASEGSQSSLGQLLR